MTATQEERNRWCALSSPLLGRCGSRIYPPFNWKGGRQKFHTLCIVVIWIAQIQSVVHASRCVVDIGLSAVRAAGKCRVSLISICWPLLWCTCSVFCVEFHIVTRYFCESATIIVMNISDWTCMWSSVYTNINILGFAIFFFFLLIQLYC